MRFQLRGLPGLGRLAQVLGLNSVPVIGLFGEGWSAGTALALYWIETVVGMLFISARIVLHRHKSRRAGHWRKAQFTAQTESERARPVRGSLLSSYLGTAIPFTAVHGLFLGLLLFLFLPREFGPAAAVSASDLGKGVLAMSAFLAVGLLIDLPGLAERPFRWIERLTERAMGRIFIIHLTIIFGMWATAFTDGPSGFFAVFAGLKTFFDLGSSLPQKELGLQPPFWLRWLDRFGKKKGETFSQFWRRTEEAQARRREANERILPPGELERRA